MKVIYTDEALRDLDEILTFVDLNYPTVSAPFQRRLRAIERRIGRWPESAQEVEQRPGVRVVPLIQYPYKIFYHVTEGAVEILHVHHAARQERQAD
jgi:plasmid stabilization system protein ParE